MDKRFLKTNRFLEVLSEFLAELAQENSQQFCLFLFSESGILGFFPLVYYGNNLSVNIFKSPFKDILL